MICKMFKLTLVIYIQLATCADDNRNGEFDAILLLNGLARDGHLDSSKVTDIQSRVAICY